MRTCILAVAAGLAAAPAMAQFSITPGGANAGNGVFANGAPPASLTSTGNANANFHATTSAAVDNMFQSGWWFRGAADTREFTFGNAVAAPYTVVGVTVGNNLGTLDTGGYDFTVSDGAGTLFTSAQRWQIVAGGGGPAVHMANVITNLRTAPLTISVYAYNDFDPNGSFGHPYSYDGGFNMSSGPIAINWTGLGHDAYQATAYSTLRGLLANAAVDNLNNTVAGSPGDFTGAFQWNLVIPGNGSMTVGSVFSIPAPGAVALLGLGGLIAARRRRA